MSIQTVGLCHITLDIRQSNWHKRQKQENIPAEFTFWHTPTTSRQKHQVWTWQSHRWKLQHSSGICRKGQSSVFQVADDILYIL